MIEETGQIVDVEGAFAWVESERTSSCSSCAVRRGCGTGAIARVLGQRRVHLRVLNRINARVGDLVVIGVSESGLVRGSLAVYAAPLFGLFAGALGSYAMASRFYPEWPTDPVAVAGALAGFVSGLFWLRGFSRRTARNPAYQPVVLRQQLRVDGGSREYHI
jgi:sigma-E factor negative regulatory protein RseC